MTELNNFLLDHGFSPPDLILDGKIHRFDHKGKKDGWYIGFQNFSNDNGAPFYVMKVGSWKTREEYEYKPQKKLSRDEKKIIDKKIKEASHKAQAEKTKKQKEAQVEANSVFDDGIENLNLPYLKRKQINALYGCKTEMTLRGRAILVPCQDVDGKVWGVQRIYEDGSKLFLSGQRIEGTYFKIGEDDIGESDELYICEGFSTGASIHQAIKKPVFCAFNAANIIQVAKNLKKAYPNSAIVICGDNDKWNEDDDNAGRFFAEKAASEVMASVVFPIFKDEKSKPTDFNDLYCLEGQKAVADQIKKAEVVKNYVICLGHRQNYYYYTTSSNKQIVSISTGGHTKTALLDLMPAEYWNTIYPSQKEGFSVDNAVNDLMKRCREKGVFSGSSVHGVGFWRDCVNLGDSLFVDGVRKPMHSIRNRSIYQIGDQLPPPTDSPLTLPECQEFLNGLAHLRWQKPDSTKYLAGWFVVAPFVGMLKWRPHIWLTGPSGSGKSYVMQDIVNNLVRDYARFFIGTTTEAGIRQAIGCDARPIIFDEFETDDEKSAERIKSILELFRQASSENDGTVVKGTTTGQAIQFHPRFSALVSSIRINLIHEADRNRFTLLELRRGGDSEQFEALKSATEKFGPELYRRLVARTYLKRDVLLANIETFWRVLADRYNQRFAQQYGALMGGFALLEKDSEVSFDEAVSMIDMCDLASDKADIEDTDEFECIDFLMSKIVRIDGINGFTERSVGEIVQNVKKAPNGVDVGAQTIIRLGLVPDGDFLYVASKHSELKRLFKGTPWIGGWSKSLARIPGADGNFQKKILGKNKKCVKIPLSTIF